MQLVDPVSIDTPDYLAAQAPPEFRSGDRLWRGQLLSLEEWLPFEHRISALTAAGDGNAPHPSVMTRLARDLTDAMFPPPSRLARAWAWIRSGGRRPLVRVADLVAALPNAVRIEVLRSFVTAQRAANGIPTGEPTTPSAGPTEGPTEATTRPPTAPPSAP